jgi:Ion channel
MAIASCPAAIIAVVRPEVVHHRYSVVLGLILACLTFQLAAPDGDGARFVAVVLQAATLIAAVITSRAHRWVVRTTIAACVLLAAAAAGFVFGTEEFGGDSARMISLLLVSLAPPVIVLGLREHFREAGGITLQTMFGVLCIYLLIGMFYGTMYGAIESVSNEPFFVSGGTEDISDFLYFSFSTLTTTGYGDLVAATSLGRSLAITEALVGQIYLVTVVGLIVAGFGRTRARQLGRG